MSEGPRIADQYDAPAPDMLVTFSVTCKPETQELYTRIWADVIK